MARKTQVTIVMGVVVQDEAVLMTQRNEVECPLAHLKWELPGGKIDFGENPKEAIEREIFEETGIRVEAQSLIPIIRTCVWDYADGSKQYTILIAFDCKFISQSKQKEKDHHVEKFKWVKLSETDKLETLPYDLDFVEEIQKLKV